MIVTSQNLVILSDEDFNENSPLIGYINYVTIANIAAENSDAEFPVTNLANSNTLLRWQAADTTEQVITVTLNGSEPVDYIGLARHNLGSVQAHVSVEVDYSGSWTEVIPEHVFGSDDPLIFRFEKETYDGVRIRIKSATAVPTIAVMYCGELTPVQRRIHNGHTPINLARLRDRRTGMSDTGEFLGTIIVGGKSSTTISLPFLTAAWYRSVFNVFARATEGEAWFFAWRPQDYPLEVGYVWRVGDVIPKNDKSNGMMTVSMNVAGIIS